MLRQTFPDLAHLKALIAAQERWPTVVLNVRSSQVYRPDVRGPLTIFMNRAGESVARTAEGGGAIPISHYFLSNAGEHYTLEIEESRGVETFNIHVGESIMEEVYRDLILPSDRLLDIDATDLRPVTFFSRMYRRDPTFELLAERYRARLLETPEGGLAADEALRDLLLHLLETHRQTARDVARLPAVRGSTRVELYRRLARAVDLMQSQPGSALTLDVLASAAFLSRFHFLRLFKAAYGKTPHQYLTEIRMERARGLLRNAKLSVTEVASLVGFEEIASFSRAFSRHVGVSPGRYRG